MDSFYAGFFVILAGIIISRVIYDKAVKKLDQEKKAELVDLYGKRNVSSLLIIAAFLGVYYFIVMFDLLNPFIAFPILIIAMLAFIVRNGLTIRKKLRQQAFPTEFIRSFLLTFTIRTVSLLLFMIVMMRDWAG